MKNEKYFNLAAILPHRPPMILIDRICSYDVGNLSLIAEFDVKEGSMFFDAGMCGVPSWVGIEYMAQTIAALNGILGLEEKSENPKIGFVLGARKYSNKIDHYKADKTYTVEIGALFYDGSMGGFKCEIKEHGGAICATAEISAFSPENVEMFLQDGVYG